MDGDQTSHHYTKHKSHSVSGQQACLRLRRTPQENLGRRRRCLRQSERRQPVQALCVPRPPPCHHTLLARVIRITTTDAIRALFLGCPVDELGAMRLEGVEWDCPSARLIPAMKSKKTRQGREMRTVPTLKTSMIMTAREPGWRMDEGRRNSYS